jgi:hypothetical protein
LDTLIIAKPARDYPWLQQHKSEVAITRLVAKLLEVALSFAREGRVGDGKDLAPYLSQLVLHPLKGRLQDTRSIHKPECIEPIRELSAMDGAFVVKRRGVMDSACRYL